jgi:predicted CXXCH cytochrome family protein
MRRRIGLVALLLGCACRAPVAALPTPPRETRSNILRADYVGSAACAGCHSELYAKWARSPMRNMTRDPVTAEIRAPFAGETFTFKSDRVTLFHQGPRRFLSLSSPGHDDRLFQVTRVIGNHYREDFAGIEIASTGDVAERGRGPELVLPVTYYFETQGYRPKGYSVMTHERPGLHAGGVWNQTCIFCHNTVPWFDRIWGELAGPTPPAYQGVAADRILPPERRFAYTVTDHAQFQAEIAREESLVTATHRRPATDDESTARAGTRALMAAFTGQHVIEEGIGCESCHGGCREHAADPRVRTSYGPTSDFLAVKPASGTAPSRALLINRTCAQCHQVLFSRYPYTWEGGLRHGRSPGGSSGTSGEARDFLMGGPGKNMACTACHDPHTADAPDKLASLATPARNDVCTGCHKAFASTEGLAEHAHHDPKGAAGACIACHMPRKNMALDYRLTRYHRIGSPTDRERVEGDRPLECALCHTDQSVARLVTDMERLWGKRYDRAKLRALYGDLEQNALTATLMHGRPHEQVAAAMTLADHRVAETAPMVAKMLESPYPLARRFAAKALSMLRQEPCAIDVDAPVEKIRAAVADCGLAAVAAVPGPAPEKEPSERSAQPGDED